MNDSDSKKGKPVFHSLFKKLEADILHGRFSEGDMLPSDIDLAKEYNVSRYTAREAYSELVRRNLVKRIRRKGTIVTYNPANTKLRKIGLIMVADVPSYYLFEKGVESVLGDRGAGLFVRYSYDIESINEEAIRDALEHDVEGLITAPPAQSSYEPYKKLIQDGLPVVLALASNPDIHSIYPNDYRAGSLVGGHFGELGCQHPAVVTHDRPYARERVYGFKEGLAHHGLKLPENRMVEIVFADEAGDYPRDFGRRECEALLAMTPRPDCVFVVNDSTAISVYYWLLKSGLRVPEDISIAGVDNLGPKFHPFQLTSVDIGLERMGVAAAEAILQQLEDPSKPPTQTQVEPKLIQSGSTARVEH